MRVRGTVRIHSLIKRSYGTVRYLHSVLSIYENNEHLEKAGVTNQLKISDKQNIAYYAVTGASYLMKPPESTTRQSAFAIFYLFPVINYILMN
jgi:hypothetical protein